MVFGLCLAFCIANFGYQAVTSKNWDDAFQRSYFQIVAVVVTWWALR